MKIKTQSLILMLGITVLPVLVLSFVLVVFRISFAAREAARFESHEALWSSGEWPSEAEVIARLVEDKPREVDLAIGDPSGKVLFSSIPAIRVGGVFSDEVMGAASLGSEERMLTFGFTPRLPAGYRAVASLARSSLIPSALFENYVVAAVIALVALVAFAAVMCISILRSITASILSLEEATRKVAAGELDTPILAKGSNELASLARSLNSLREEIKEDQARQNRFIMSISHDLKTPLALVKGYAEAVEAELEDSEDEARRNAGALGYMKIIEAKADQLEGMIDDLIDFVRMDTGEWSSGLSEIELAPFFGGFVRRVAADATLLGRSADSSIDLPEGFRLRFDERLFTRALENLAYNALRYTPEGGLISISARLEDGVCIVEVSDNGPGIKKEDLPHIFEPFYRGTTSRREQGMGLGLSIVKSVIETHGWSIKAESEGGATFTIRMAQGPSPEDRAKKRGRNKEKMKRIGDT